MRFVVKDMDIATGDTPIVILNEKDANDLDLHHMDRVVVKRGRRELVAALDIAESSKAVPPGKIGFFEEALDGLGVVHKDTVTLKFAEKPESVSWIRKKMDGKELSEKEMFEIMQDIAQNKLTAIELTSFVVSLYVQGMSDREVLCMSKGLAKSGETIEFKDRPIVDFHCIGGVPGNRTTMIVAPILVAAGLKVPKTSSRAITSPAGTADTMEVLCSVTLSAQRLKKLVNEVGGVIAWGGGVNLAPADDQMIRIEHPLHINAEGEMLASIMAKKFNVGATHVLIDIPVGNETKVPDREQARRLSRKFVKLGKDLGMKVKTIITDGSEPVGNGIGPVLEARDCLCVLKNDERAPKDLLRRSVKMAGTILEFAGKANKGQGNGMATRLLRTGAAYGAMVRMIEAQDGKEIQPDELKLAPQQRVVKAYTSGVVAEVNNAHMAKVARLAGAPIQKQAGVFLEVHKGSRVKKGDALFVVHARSKRKIKYALDAFDQYDGIVIK